MANRNKNRSGNGGKFEQRDLSGSLFENDKKTQENQPDMRGSAKIDGVEYWVSAWMKENSSGNDWLSLAFQEKDADYEQKSSSPKSSAKKLGKKSREEVEDEPEETTDESEDDEDDNDDNGEVDEDEIAPPKKGSSKPAAKKLSKK